MLVKEVIPIGNIGINLLKEENPEEIIDEIIEEPLKKPCKVFLKKGIRTVMSSANRTNIVQTDQRPKKKEDVAKGGNYLFLKNASFEDAGVGYAWIMLDFDSLSDINKEILLRLEERKDKYGNNIGEEVIWFVHPFKIGNVDYMLKTGQLDYGLVKSIMAEDEEPTENIEVDPRFVDFEKKSIILSYNSSIYPANTVMLRMPIDNDTTVNEVEEYFCKIAELLKDQKEHDVMGNNNKELEER